MGEDFHEKYRPPKMDSSYSICMYVIEAILQQDPIRDVFIDPSLGF